MSKARQLNENNNYYTAWMVDYSIKFDGCASVPEFEREEGLRANLLAKFKLCPSDKCNSCPNAGEYVVDLREFVESFQEAQREANEYACEVQEETCEYQCENGQYQYQNEYNDDANGQNNQNGNNQNQNNNGGDDGDYCKYMCMSEANMSYCDNDGDDMDAKEFAECRAMEDENQNQNQNNYYNGNNNNNYQVYYTGAYCTSSGVYASVFTDSACTKKAPSGTYEKYNNGYSLPTEPLVRSGCQSCKYTSNNNDDQNNGQNNNNNQNNNDDNNNNGVIELCEDLYEQAGKCEKKLKGTSYQDTSGCELIHSILPKLSSAFSTMNGRVSVTKVLAWVFGVSCVLMGAYIYLLHKKVIRQKVDLATLGIGGGGAGADGVAA